MATKIITKNSSTTTAIPTAADLVQGELAVNVTDKRLFTENSVGAIVELGTNPSTLTVTGAATFSGDVTIGSATGQNSVFGTIIGSGGANEGAVIVSSATGTGWLGFNDGNNASIPGQVTYNHATNVLSLYSSGTVSVTGAATFSGDMNFSTLWGASSPIINLRENGNSKIQLGTSAGYGVRVAAPSDATDALSVGTLSIIDGTTYSELFKVSSTGAATFSDTVWLLDGKNIYLGTDGDMRVRHDNSNGYIDCVTGSLIFRTGGGATESVRIDGAGNVGIGTSSPVRQASIYGASSAAISFHNSTTGSLVSDGLFVGNDASLAYVYNYEATPIVFATSATEAMRITSAGAMQIAGNGTDNDSYPITFKNGAVALARDDNDLKLHGYSNIVFGVSNTSYPASTERMRLNSAGTLLINSSTTADTGGNKLFINSGVNALPATSGTTQTGGALRLRGANNAVLDMGLDGVTTWIQATDKVNLANGYTLALNPNGGNVLVGTTSPYNYSGIAPLLTIDNHAGIGIRNVGASDAGYSTIPSANHNYYAGFFLNSSGAGVGNILCTANSTAYNTSSDYRLKEDDVPMTGATERVKALRPINFAWKVDGSRVDGFFAHELAEVVPECSTGTKDAMRDEEYEVTPAVEEIVDEDGNVTTEAVEAVMGTRSVPDYQGIDQSKLVPLLTAALQEAITKIEDLTARLEALEGA